MGPIRDRGLCIYCGSPADTDDHVPPKCFLEQPLPDNPIKVPSCFRCNNRSSLDEEYAIALLSLVGITNSLTAKSAEGGRVDRAFQRRPSFEQRFIDRMKMDELGRVAVLPEFERLDSVLTKVVAGLYWNRYERMVSRERLGPIGYWLLASEQVPAEVFISTYSERFRLKRWRIVQPGVFAYIFARLQDGSLSCIVRWHETLWVTCVVPHPSGRRGRKLQPNQDRLFDPAKSYASRVRGRSPESWTDSAPTWHLHREST